MSKDEKPVLELKAEISAHNGWVTQLVTSPKNPNILASASRDKTILLWELQKDYNGLGARPFKSLVGHGHFVSDVVISSDGEHAISGSWDKILRLWDLNTGKNIRKFISHTKDVLSVAFSQDNRLIVSGSRDKTVKLWNTLGDCKVTLSESNEGHSNWVSCVRFASTEKSPSIVSTGWDKVVKVWDVTSCRLKANHIGHTGPIYTTTISPDGALCASAGKDGRIHMWDLALSEYLQTFDGNTPINTLAFSPTRYWLCSASGATLKIWDLDKKDVVQEVEIEGPRSLECTSLTWSNDGDILFAGFIDGTIRIWNVLASRPQN